MDTEIDPPSIDRKMGIYYHGTTDTNLFLIMRDGLKAGSYLARDLGDALEFGGNVVIEIALFKDLFDPMPLVDDWQWSTKHDIPSDYFVRIKKYGDAYTIHENSILRDTVFWSSLDKDQREINNRGGIFFDYARGVVGEKEV